MWRTKYYKNKVTGKLITFGIYKHLKLEENIRNFIEVPENEKFQEYEKYVKNSDVFFYSPLLKTFFTLEDIIGFAPDIALGVRIATPTETKNLQKNFNAISQRFFVDNNLYRE